MKPLDIADLTVEGFNRSGYGYMIKLNITTQQPETILSMAGALLLREYLSKAIDFAMLKEMEIV